MIMALTRRCYRLLLQSMIKTDLHYCSCNYHTTHFCSTHTPIQDSNAHNSSPHPFQQNQTVDVSKKFAWFGKYGPEFHIRGEQVQIISEPTQFYEILKVKTRKAKRRVTLASLYLGNGRLEQDLVSSIDDACQAASNESSDLEVNVLLDFTRGSRGQVNSRTMLRPLLEKWPNVNVALYHTPDLRGWLKKIVPERFNETIGLTHMKVYLIDDSFIISGANLSNDYFTNRQDRNILFNNCPQLADFFDNLVKSAMSFSLQLHSDDSLHLAPDWTVHPFLDSDNGFNFKVAAREKIQQCLAAHSVTQEDEVDEEGHDYSIPTQVDTDTVIYPLVQMGPLGVQNDELATVELFLRSEPTDLILLTSGYFNLTDQYADVIVDNADSKFNILMASPKANGFLGANGIAGAVPYSYIYLADQFYKRVSKAKQSHRIHMMEYEREGWTFHSKGLWYYLKNDPLPRLTLIGSPNFGFRSVYRDLECQVAIVTENKSLQEQLRQEHVHLYTNSHSVSAETFQRPDRYVPLWTRLVTSFIKHFF